MKSMIIIKIILLINLIVLINYLLNEIIKINLFNPKNLNLVKTNKFKFIINENEILFNLTSTILSNNQKDNIIKVQYTIDFYYKNDISIVPSDLTLYNNLNVYCFMNDITKNITILSLANILNNKHYECVEFFKLKGQIFLGILINDTKNNFNTKINLISNLKIILYYYKYKINNQFNCESSNQEYINIIENNDNIDNKGILKNSLSLKLSYISKPKCVSSFQANINDNEWEFTNLYNTYFCICRGLNCLFRDIPQTCKYYFYLNIIDNNKFVYNKTDFLFCDFILNEYSSDDTYPVFQEMINQNLPVHYLTQNINIYNKYCELNNNCLSVIFLFNTTMIDGDFLEKYLTIFLKLKAAITGAEFYYINNLFKNIDYIMHVCVGHGVSFFKSFLYESNSYYGNKRFDKILIPPSEKLISIAKKYNWTDENIIKINLPRWYKYDIFDNNKNEEIKNKSIFVMFTWRCINFNETISFDYIKNIEKLLNNEILIKKLKDNNIILYYTLHHQFLKYKEVLQLNNYIKYIEENQISNILSKTNLIVTDFSSIIFDLIYRKKPYIIYIPDSNDPLIENKYTLDYYKLIKDMKNNIIKFENKFFTIEEVIKKIIYYINNNFELEKKLKIFYDSFKFKHQNSINQFIKYLKTIYYKHPNRSPLG